MLTPKYSNFTGPGGTNSFIDFHDRPGKNPGFMMKDYIGSNNNGFFISKQYADASDVLVVRDGGSSGDTLLATINDSGNEVGLT